MNANSPKIFMDFEFCQTVGREAVGTLQPLSVGLVCGRDELYIEYLTDLDAVGRLDPWLVLNVIEHLRAPRTRVFRAALVAETIESFVARQGPNPEFWAWRSASDWNCLIQTFGGWHKLPAFFGKSCHDLALYAERVTAPGKPIPRMSRGRHHALSDARRAQELYNRI